MADIGDVTGTLRADVSQWVANFTAARESSRQFAAQSAVAASVVETLQKKLAAGSITAQQFNAALLPFQQTFTRFNAAATQSAVAAGATAASVERLAVSAPMSTRGLMMVDRQLGFLAASALGTKGQFGSLAAGLLMFGGGSVVTLGVLAGAAAIVVGYLALTTQTRKLKAEHDALIKTLDEESKKSVPATVAAIEKASAVEQDWADAVKAHSDANRVLQQFAGTVGGMGGKGPALEIKGGLTKDEQQAFTRGLQAQADLYTTNQVAIKKYVGELAEAVKVGVLSNAEMHGAIELETNLGKVMRDGTRSIADRVEADKEHFALRMAGLEIGKRDRDLDRELVKGKSDVAAASGLDTNAVKKLTAEYALLEKQLKSANLSDADRVRLLQREAEIQRTLNPSNIGGTGLTQTPGPGLQPGQVGAGMTGLLAGGGGAIGSAPGGSDYSNDVAIALAKRQAQMRQGVTRLVVDLSRTLVDGIIGSGKSIAQALTDMFKKVFEEVATAIIAQALVKPILNALHLGMSASSSSEGSSLGPFGAILGLGSLFGFEANGMFRRGGGTVVVPLSGMPHAPSPMVQARDAQWLHVFRETARVAQGQGLTLQVS